MKWLTGLKSVIGLAVVTVATFIPSVAPDVAKAVGDGVLLAAEGVGIILTAVGIGHKQARLKAAGSK